MNLKKKVISVTLAISLSAVVAFTGFKVFRHNGGILSSKNSKLINADSIADNKTAQINKSNNDGKNINTKDNVMKVSTKSSKDNGSKIITSVKLEKANLSKHKVVEEKANVQINQCFMEKDNNKDLKEITQDLCEKKEEQSLPQQPTQAILSKQTISKPSTSEVQQQPSKDKTSVTNNTTNVDVSGLEPLPTKYNISVSSSQEQTILNLLNEKRRQAGLRELIMDNTLIKVARYKSNHMIQYDYFNHTTPKGEMWYDWLRKIGYTYNGTAENIAYNYSGAVELFNQWWNSQGHRDNMMNPTYTKIGIGVVYNIDKGIYMGTQTFAN